MLQVAEDAAQFCTASYRSPELFDPPKDLSLDSRTDVWAMGCLLFAWWFGYSPFECEFVGNQIKVTECSSLRVLSKIPRPRQVTSSEDELILNTVEWILEKDLTKRPFLSEVIGKMNSLLESITPVNISNKNNPSSSTSSSSTFQKDQKSLDHYI
jgi:serine/threonine kinase 16